MNEIILITGLSGSGKSTIALSRNYEDYIKIHLDYFDECYLLKSVKEVYEKYGFLFYSFFVNNPGAFEKLKSDPLNYDILVLFIRYVLNWCGQDTENDYIVEGVQLFQCVEDINYSVNFKYIIADESMFKCYLRRIKRRLKVKDKEECFSLKLLYEYYIDRKYLKIFCNKIRGFPHVAYITK